MLKIPIIFFDLSVPILELSKKFQYDFEQPELKSHHRHSSTSSSSSSSSSLSSISSSDVETLCTEEAFAIQRAANDIVNNQGATLQGAINQIFIDCQAFVTG